MCFHISGIYYIILYVGAVNVLPYIGYILYYIYVGAVNVLPYIGYIL